MLTERQKTAEALAREISRMGGWVVSPMPLDASARLRFQVLDESREKVLEILSSWDWSPAFCGMLPRITLNGMRPGSIYEIDLPPERQAIADDRTVHGEIGREKPSAEVLAMLRAIGVRK
jgi:hypothetical protein